MISPSDLTALFSSSFYENTLNVNVEFVKYSFSLKWNTTVDKCNSDYSYILCSILVKHFNAS